jgi:hypothetical protein
VREQHGGERMDEIIGEMTCLKLYEHSFCKTGGEELARDGVVFFGQLERCVRFAPAAVLVLSITCERCTVALARQGEG